MTTTDPMPYPAPAAPGGGLRRRPPAAARGRARGAGRLLALAIAAVVAGLTVGRFVSFDAAPAAGPLPRPVAVVGATDDGAGRDLARLEARLDDAPDDVAALQELGGLALRQAIATGDPSGYVRAEEAFDRAEALAPRDPLTSLGRAQLALSQHRFADALVLGEAALAELPSNATALGAIVDAQVELGSYDAAAVTVQEALDVRPNLPALARASYVRQLTGDLDGAVGAMRQAETAGGGLDAFDVASVAALVGDLELARADIDAALAAYQRAERLRPGLPAAVLGGARAAAARGDLVASEAVLAELVDAVPLPEAATLLGELRALRGDDAGAAEAFEVVRTVAALQEAAGQVVDLELALFEADHGDAVRAVALARSAYDARPANVFAADALAWSLLRAGDVDEAAAYAEEALRLDTADPLLRFRAATVLAEAGQDERARDALDGWVDAIRASSAWYAADVDALADRLGTDGRR